MRIYVICVEAGVTEKSFSCQTLASECMPFPLLPRTGRQSGLVQTCASFFKSRGLACICLFVLESQRGQRKIAARQFPYSKMEVSLGLHSIHCGSRGYPANPMITREIKSLPHQLFDSGRKRKRLLPHVCSPRRPLGQKCQAEIAFSLHSCGKELSDP